MYKMESGMIMLFHSAVIGVLAFLFMKFGLKQAQRVAEDRSVLLFSATLLYMVLFGHGMPNKINKNII